MAIISCPECSNQVSDKATNCPHCGFSIASKISNEQNKSKLPVIFWGIGILIVSGIIFAATNTNRKSLECSQFKSIQEDKYYLENPSSTKTGAIEQKKTTQIIYKLESMQISDSNLKEVHQRYVANYRKLSSLYSSGLEIVKKLKNLTDEIGKGKPKTVETDRLSSQNIEELISIINQIKFASEETKSIDLEFAKICSSN
jgi:hypothetical protein